MERHSSHAVLVNRCLIALFMLLACLSHPQRAKAQKDFCVTQTDVVTGSPQIDGIVYAVDSKNIAPDAGWTNAARYNLFPFNSMSPLNDGYGMAKIGDLQLVRDSSFVYISYAIQTPAPEVDDTIVLVLSTDGNSAHDWRIEIKPFDVAITDGNSFTPSQVHYWRDSTQWNNPSAVRDPVAAPWLGTNIKYSTYSGTWAIEIKIPVEPVMANASEATAIYFPPSGSFSLYADVLQTAAGTLLGSVAQSPWPVTSGIIPSAADSILEHNTPGSSQWGTASFDSPTVHTACTGLSIGAGDIAVVNVDNPPPGSTSLLRYKFGNPEVLPTVCTVLDATTPAGPKNQILGTVHNNMLTDAPKVTMTYRFANWGLPAIDPAVGDWSLAGGSPSAGLISPFNTNPTTIQTVTAGSPAQFEVDWELTQRQSCDYAKGGAWPGHFCMLAQIDSGDGSVRFTNTSVRVNTNFVTASAFSAQAQISAVGYTNAPGHAGQDFLITVDKEVRSYQAKDGNRMYCQTNGKGATTGTVGKDGPQDPSRQTASVLFNRDLYSCIPASYYPKGLSQAMLWTARGYRLTGTYLTINNHKYELVDGIGGFGYVAGHNGKIGKWHQNLSGPGLKQIKPGFYTIQIPTGSKAAVTTSIVPVGCALFGSAGMLVMFPGMTLLGVLVYFGSRKKT
jgi:hypothetical protein